MIEINSPLITITSCSILLSSLSLLFWKKYEKTVLLYAHIIFLFAPLFYAAFTINCSLKIVNSLLGFCAVIFAKFILYVLPLVMLSAILAGRIIIPRIYKASSEEMNSMRLKALSEKAGIIAMFRLIDTAVPKAFTAGKTIFLSVGFFEILSKKEQDAVILHELYHVRSRSAWNKFTMNFASWFSPFAAFSHNNLAKDERRADFFASQIQGTAIHINHARKKMLCF